MNILIFGTGRNGLAYKNYVETLADDKILGFPEFAIY